MSFKLARVRRDPTIVDRQPAPEHQTGFDISSMALLYRVTEYRRQS